MPKKGQTNNVLGDLAQDAKSRRDQIEGALVGLHTLIVDIDEVSMRINQAISRTPLVSPVLEPAVKRAALIRAHLSTLHTELSEYWRTGQSRRWE